MDDAGLRGTLPDEERLDSPDPADLAAGTQLLGHTSPQLRVHDLHKAASICAEESDRLSARKKAAEGRVARLRNLLLGFMLARGIKKLDGDKASIGMQLNSTPSLIIDDPLQIGERFFESTLRFTKTELQEIAYQLPEGDLQRRLEAELKRDHWEINGSAVRAAIVNNEPLSGARLVKGHHVRVR